MKAVSPTTTKDVSAQGASPSASARMRCNACNRCLTRSAYSVGRLNFGPTCFKKLLAEGRKAKRVELDLRPAGDLLDGCYFDQRGAEDRASLFSGAQI